MSRATAISRTPDIPSTYVPARNTIFLSLALGWAEVLGARDLVIGVNALDYSGYPDCRPEFIQAFEALAAVATRAGVEGARFRVHTPLIRMTKAEIIRRGVALGLDYGLTHSCYDPSPRGQSVRTLRQLRAARQGICSKRASSIPCFCARISSRVVEISSHSTHSPAGRRGSVRPAAARRRRGCLVRQSGCARNGATKSRPRPAASRPPPPPCSTNISAVSTPWRRSSCAIRP